jgi:type 1 fimbria pilin
MTRFFASFALAAVAFALAPQALKAANPLCPLLNATKHGTYVVYGTGTIVGVGPAVAVGEITYDGHGNTLATFTLNVNGNVQRNTDVPGTYSINSDCTGTSLEAGAHYSFVVSPDGNTTTWMETDPGTVVSGTEVRLKPTDTEDAVLVSPRNRETVQVLLGSATNSESLSIALRVPENDSSDRSLHEWLCHLNGHRMETT